MIWFKTFLGNGRVENKNIMLYYVKMITPLLINKKIFIKAY